MSFLTSREQVAPQGIGKPVRRREDARLLTGGGRFADDTNLPGQGYACMVRSPHAHALIADIDTGPAEGMPGVIAVLTGSDAERDGLQPIPHRPVPANPHEVPLKSGDGSPFFLAPHRFWRSSRSAMSARRSRLSSPKRCRRRRTRPSGSRCGTNRCPQSPARPMAWRRSKNPSLKRPVSPVAPE